MLRKALKSPVPLPYTCLRRGYRSPIGQPLLGRYSVLPADFFRINDSVKVVLRDYEAQKRKGRTPFDLLLGKDGWVHPHSGDIFEGSSLIHLSFVCLTSQV